MPKRLEVKVTRVVSGQTLEVTGIDKQPETFSPLAPRPSMQVRLVGIDAPDLQQQPWGQAAKERLEAMIEGRPVLLEFDVQDKDTFGRRLAYVWQDGVLLNEKLVKEGYVLRVTRSSFTPLSHLKIGCDYYITIGGGSNFEERRFH
ncbi:thermonuclease family protein [Chroococcidiopsis sp. CCMEE 29]|uniref:thermonuclease family protein n=1 Tax=Chroococcidiopsis sp. CCMEE 29 TaxID=155894 RepID=UPI002022496B|nr:thermonuclease family protein [Chroococcidiopsis sp. CCMEE 29]